MMPTEGRPSLPFEAEAGFRWEVVPDEDWTLLSASSEPKVCRWWEQSGTWSEGKRERRRCGNRAIANLHRPVGRPRESSRPWAYCGEHLYGRWVEGGAVVGWRLRRG